MLLIATTLLTLCAGIANAPADDALVRHDGRPYPIAELPEELGEAPRDAAGAWASWCDENGYAMELDDDGRVLLITAKSSKKLPKARTLVGKTTKHFDKLLPAPTETGGDGPSAGEWGSGTVKLDHETAVLFVLRDTKDQARLLDELAEQHDYLAGWTQGAKNLVGFVLEQPLVGAYLESAPTPRRVAPRERTRAPLVGTALPAPLRPSTVVDPARCRLEHRDRHREDGLLLPVPLRVHLRRRTRRLAGQRPRPLQAQGQGGEAARPRAAHQVDPRQLPQPIRLDRLRRRRLPLEGNTATRCRPSCATCAATATRTSARTTATAPGAASSVTRSRSTRCRS